MKPDAKPRQTLGALDRIRRRGTRHHEARRGENAAAMRSFDRLVDGQREPEIVGGDDEPLHAASAARLRIGATGVPRSSRGTITSLWETTITSCLAAR